MSKPSCLLSSLLLWCVMSSNGFSAAKDLECHFKYRASTGDSWQEQVSTLSLESRYDSAELTLGDFKIGAYANLDPFEGSYFKIYVYDENDEIKQSLLRQAPYHETNGRFGITGMNYVYRHSSRAQLKYFCRINRD